jgi:signal transduction histidine kinase
MAYETQQFLPEMVRPRADSPRTGLETASLRRQQSEAETGAKQEALERMEQLRSEMLRTMEILHSVRALFEVKPGVTREEFRHFVQSALVRLPELQALEWIPRVSQAERPAFEAAALADGIEGFHLKEIDASGQIAVAAARPEYFPVFYAEPVLTNAPALGLDLLADPKRREALERASRTGLPTATSPLRLAQVKGERLGFLVMTPVHSADNGIIGFGLAVFQVGSLVDEIFSPLVWRGVNIEIHDADDPSAAIYTGGTPDDSEATWRYQQELPLMGRLWRFTFTPNAEFSIADPDWLRRSAEMLQRTNEVLEESVVERTAQLAESNAALKREIEVRKAAERAAAAANLAKSLFLAEMSHEIRTPLNIILGYTQLLQRDPALASKQVEAMRAIVEGGNHLLCLVDGVLDLTKIETGKMELELVEFDLTTIMKALAAMFGPRCQQKELTFRLESLGDRPIWVRGDERKLRQVLVNLLGNAVKFTDKGEIRLRVVPAGGPDTFRFEVIDTGAGIPLDVQSAIFEPFKQDAAGRSKGGTGLGLSIARRLIEMMGGALMVNSAPGWGSDFFFTISFAPARSADPIHLESSSGLKLEAGARVRALVIEPIRTNRVVLGEMLTALGCEVAIVETVEEAELAEAPDVVLADLRLCDVEKLAAGGLPAWPRAPRFVCYSASAFEHERDLGLPPGFDSFLPKPFRMVQICECLSRLLGVTFSARPETPPSDGPPPLQLGELRLPRELLLRLGSSAEIGDTAELRKVLAEIEQLGVNEAEFARRLLVSVGRFDSEAVAKWLAALAAEIH